jgi:hypothetical protein
MVVGCEQSFEPSTSCDEGIVNRLILYHEMMDTLIIDEGCSDDGCSKVVNALL